MSEVIVTELADVIGVSPERLITQMAEAGIKGKKQDSKVTDDERQALLLHLKRAHGEASADEDGQPKKISLKRKSTTQLKTTGGSGRKTVNVEVRKTRTYVKRTEVEAEETAEAEVAAVATAETVVDSPVVAATVAATTKTEDKADATAKAIETPKIPTAAPKVPVVEEQKTAAEIAEDQRREQERSAAEKEAEKAAEAAAKEHVAHEGERLAAEAAAQKKAVEDAARIAKEDAEDQAKADVIAQATPKKAPVHKKPAREEKKPAKSKSTGSGRSDKRNRRGKISRNARSKPAVLSSGSPNQHGFTEPQAARVHEVAVPESIIVAELAKKMSVKAAEVIKVMFKMGAMATINQVIDQDTAILVVEEMGHIAKPMADNAIEEALLDSVDTEGEAISRAPVVTVMGHVDHGKTSLLDNIRASRVASGESGGITQHIGAYRVKTSKGLITFLDTPGHAAFTAMRARGAQLTDIVVLAVAADDGVMPQTKEAVQHAKAAGVPLVIAVNKIDKEQADPDRVMNELAALDVIPEEWGGDVQFVKVSAKTGEGIENLLEAISLQAELLELTAVEAGQAQGVVIESRLEKGRGAVATVLVQSGQLKKGDIVLAGLHYGRVRAMMDENGDAVTMAGPSEPIEIIGLDGTPSAGAEFTVVSNDKKAREVALFRQGKYREIKLARQQASKLENLFANMESGDVATLNIVLKTDVRGSLEALTTALEDLSTDEVKVVIVSSGVGGIAETDANLAMASSALMVGFNVRADSQAKAIVDREGLQLRYYSIIYNIIDDVKQAMSGLLSPELREEIVGIAQVRDVFRSPKIGLVAGCMVTEGSVFRNKKIRVLRDNVVIYEGDLESLRRFKESVAEVRQGMECGIGVKNYNDVKVGDQIEVFDTVEIARTID
ncbi:MAG: translation initiation factor IF-2 [Osedax symbiont Rs1]|nr:MAG: translation initiation factor IF-2 [Osedax symbiont Rs1]